MFQLKDKTITIIGAQRSGIAAAKLALRKGASVKISDTKKINEISNEIISWINENKIELECSEHSKEFVTKSDLIVISPGVKADSEVLNWARESGVPILGEIEFAYQYTTKPVIAVTGSNGKTTVSTLIHDVIKEAGKQVCLCGNVGFPFSDFVSDDAQIDYYVVEVSSFQMEALIKESSVKGFTFKKFRPFIGVLLNISDNHLDRHKDFEEYFSAKKRIFENQTKDDYAVLNLQSSLLQRLSTQLVSQVLFFNKIDGFFSNPNFCAVQQVAEILGISPEIYTQVFEQFSGVEHRMEFVRTLEGIDYVNDSKSTTAEAGRWALNNSQKPTLLICGGRDKNIDFTPLKEIVQDKVKKMFVIGEAREKLISIFKDNVEIEDCSDLNDAVVKARNNAKEGDCILLSPMCVSFDMFKDFEDRGRQFKKIAQELN